ncbi:ribbon-helix-helix domain-containing protein [Georgenia sp. Z1344]|uniref:ribbon-helix-helix domain-containing protein n=1 Tax=Georgenia sp. Z1344 TaxID=3416706 RepID=UPI003CFAA4A6
MKVSVSIPDDDVRFLDEYAARAGLSSRSAALQRAVRSLRAQELRPEYAAAFDQWDASDESEAWDRATTDGLGGNGLGGNGLSGDGLSDEGLSGDAAR